MLKIQLYVPTADRNNQPLELAEVANARHTAELLLHSLGASGWTAHEGEGGWYSTDAGRVIREKVVVYNSVLDDPENEGLVIDQIKVWASQTAFTLNNEAVMFTVERSNIQAFFVDGSIFDALFSV